MTEEEKKTFNFLKNFVKTEIDYCKLEKADVLDILNIIEKLQNENERRQDIIIEKNRQLHLMNKEIQSVREQVWEITDKSLKDILMLNTPKIIIKSKEDIKGLLDNYIPKSKINEIYERYYYQCDGKFGGMSSENMFNFIMEIEQLLEEK